MNAQRTMLIAVVWGLLVAPLACVTGILDHYCAPCAEICDGHEVDCFDDPCNLELPPLVKSWSDDPLSTDGPFIADASWLNDFSPSQDPGAPAFLSHPPGLQPLSTHGAALPLLC